MKLKLTRRALAWLVVGVVVMGLVSCTHGHRAFEHPGHRFVAGDNTRDNYVLQVDDYGEFRNDADEEVLAAIRASAAQTNTVVAIYIHGWHHNAAPDDTDLLHFAESLQKIRATLDSGEVYRGSRRELTNVEDLRVIGVYVGWRGQSLPGPLDYLTFWGRKAAAERVGEGDLRGFLAQLQELYVEANARKRPPANPDGTADKSPRPFLGLVTFGHSFGGQVLFRAVEGTLERELVEATARAKQPGAAFRPVDGFGDLVVLINPALEAHQYRRIHQLSQALTFDRRQPPVLMVVSEETDWARSAFFPAGRWINTWSRAPFNEREQRLQWIQALGEYAPQRTHRITIDIAKTSRLFDPTVYQDPCRVVDFDLTDIDSIGGVHLKPLKQGGAYKDFNPFLVAYTDKNAILINNHSGFFPSRDQRDEAKTKFQDFVNDYVAMVEGKRILLREGYGESCAGPAAPPAAPAAAMTAKPAAVQAAWPGPEPLAPQY